MAIITEKEAAKAVETLRKYKDAKAELDRRIVSNEDWFRMRNMSTSAEGSSAQYSSGWLFNSIASKHADAMDSMPTPTVLPREESDIDIAQTLSEILPVVLEQSGFDDTYNRAWWRKLKAGTAVYSVVWNRSLCNGVGDIDIRLIDILNLFWEPGISDISQSRNVFHVELWDNDILYKAYPESEGAGSDFETAAYIHDPKADTTEKTAVIDWYYKKSEGGRTLLHYAKLANGRVLFASENEPERYPDGFYEHGEYPFVFDYLFAQEGSPAGFSLVDVMKGCQLYIDKLNSIILDNAALSAKKRFFIKDLAGVNEDEFRDWSRDLIHCTTANLGEDAIRELEVSPLPSNVLSVLQMKIDELKEISSNRDVSQGGVSGGVTAASAIVALQEAGSKMSRDMINASFRAFVKITVLCIELIRQFYSEPRCFRIIGRNGEMRFESFSNKGLADSERSILGQALEPRKPHFDIKVSSQKASPFSRISQNELAKELYSMGVFLPENRQQALTLLEMMDFEGKQLIAERISRSAEGVQGVNEVKAVQGV